MAIVIEKEKRGMNWFAILIILVSAVVIGAAAYYLFFTETPLIEKVIPYQIQVSSQLSQIQTQSVVQAVTDNKFYKSLQKYSILPEVSSENIGKTNPFK